jgi:DNA-binding NarL/FixJ family response regulator
VDSITRAVVAPLCAKPASRKSPSRVALTATAAYEYAPSGVGLSADLTATFDRVAHNHLLTMCELLRVSNLEPLTAFASEFLTRRELEIVYLLERGLSNEEIASLRLGTVFAGN